MRTVKVFLTALAAAAIAACSSGGSDDSLTGGSGGTGNQPPTGPTIDSISLITSSPQVPSDGSANATITALVRDANNNVVEGVSVLFQSDSGSLVATQPTVTDVNGQVTATIATAGDPTNRTITITGTADTLTDDVTVDVVGTTLLVSGPGNLPQSQIGDYNIVLTDSSGNGIGGVTVDLTSSNSNTLSNAQITTAANGQAAFTVTADNGGADTITATALGIQATQSLTVSDDSFAFTDPDPALPPEEVTLGVNRNVTVTWQQNGAGVDGQPVNFATTRGTLTAFQVNTVAGVATVGVSSNNAGTGTITATNSAGTSTQVQIEFVATQADTIELQAAPFTVAPNEQSVITAVVRDPAGNLVKNKIVDFQLQDVTGGSLTVAQAITDSQGRASTTYTASGTASASNGVTITATVQDTPTVQNSVNLTVAAREVFVSIGTGNEIFELDSATYRKEYTVIVTDVQGNPVEDAQVQLSILSERYFKGTRTFPPGATCWSTNVTIDCLDEDLDRNGILDGAEDGIVACNGVLDAGEDLNQNGILDFGDDTNQSCRVEAGNIATVSVQGVGGGTMTTDENGRGLVDVIYPQEFASWVEVTIEATVNVQGTEFAEALTFVLPGSAEDFCNQMVTPPGTPSPFGVGLTCSDTL